MFKDLIEGLEYALEGGADPINPGTDPLINSKRAERATFNAHSASHPGTHTAAADAHHRAASLWGARHRDISGKKDYSMGTKKVSRLTSLANKAREMYDSHMKSRDQHRKLGKR